MPILPKGAAAPLRKTILILSDRAPHLLLLGLNGGHPFINETAADIGFLTVIGLLASRFLLN
jgi:hypothetical protein